VPATLTFLHRQSPKSVLVSGVKFRFVRSSTVLYLGFVNEDVRLREIVAWADMQIRRSKRLLLDARMMRQEPRIRLQDVKRLTKALQIAVSESRFPKK
jgi:hypothetical protein